MWKESTLVGCSNIFRNRIPLRSDVGDSKVHKFILDKLAGTVRTSSAQHFKMNELRDFSILILFLTGGCKLLSLQISLHFSHMKWNRSLACHRGMTRKCASNQVFTLHETMRVNCCLLAIPVRLATSHLPFHMYKKLLLSSMEHSSRTNFVAEYIPFRQFNLNN